MSFSAKALYLRYSPFKLRPIVDVIRGKNVRAALNWLSTCHLKRAVPVRKVLHSAAANAKNLSNLDFEDLVIFDIRVDHGPMHKYFKPGAMGRANIQKKRTSHIRVQLASAKKEV